MGGLLHLVQRGGDWAGPQPAQASTHCRKCNSPPINGQCTNHLNGVCILTAVCFVRFSARFFISVNKIYYYYNGPLLCGFNVAIKG